jgi:hypothetical protein
MLCKSCRSTHMESNKISLHFYDFLVILYEFFQANGPMGKRNKSLFLLQPLNFWTRRRYTLVFAQRTLHDFGLHKYAICGGVSSPPVREGSSKQTSKSGVWFSSPKVREGGSRIFVGYSESRHGGRMVVLWECTAGQWRPRRAGVGVCGRATCHRPMARRVSCPLGTKCPRHLASDRWSQ